MFAIRAIACASVLVGSAFAGAPEGQQIGPESEVYRDLHRDPVAVKVLTAWYWAYGGSGVLSQYEGQIVTEWLRDRDEVSYPVLVEIFLRDNDPRRRRRVIDWMAAGTGNKKGILAELRKELPRWVGEMPEHDPYPALVDSACRFIAACGELEDIQILREVAASQSKAIWVETAEKYLKHPRARMVETNGQGTSGADPQMPNKSR